MIYCEENVQNIYGDDINEDDTSYWVVVPKRIWKVFDCYCYSKFTDNLPESASVIVATDLKTVEVIDFEDKDN